MAAYKIVMVRQGESEWNQKNLFCGWFDADLSETGIGEAKNAGMMLKEKGFTFDCAFTSVLKRAIKTLYLIQEALDLHWIPVTRHWRLNERHYGALQGLNKSETAQKYGEDQVKIWRRSYNVPPPPLEEGDSRCASGQKAYKELDKKVIPKCECLKDTVARALPFWHDVIIPALRAGKKPIIAAHGNSLRALVKYLDKMTDDEILNLNIPTGIPLVYELDKDLNPIKHYYVADEAQVKAAKDKEELENLVKTQMDKSDDGITPCK